ncbi:DNA repair protein RAD50 [Cyberlindnera fabianii]|nr:DNA repair protein RAD50 [Cyberlindnera fabianii]
MYGEKEVKAEVKLAFQSMSGNSMVCTRNMQVISKKGAANNTFKTLEGQLLQMNRGERSTISTKCAELDDLVPKNLGTPRPILEYVVFCHQEDSLWPLSEPSILKKRFDEIFEALKFTKALDTLKVIRRDMSTEIKLLNQAVTHLKQDKDRAQRTRERLEKNRDVIERYLQETTVLENEIKEVTRESDVLFKSNQEFQEVLSKLDSMRHEERSVSEQITRLTSSCTLLADDDKDLQYRLANFQRLMNESSDRVTELKTALHTHEEELREVRKNEGVLIREEGQLRSKADDYETNLVTRDSLLEKLEEFVSVSSDFEAVQAELQSFLKSHQSKLEAKADEIEKQHQLAQKEIQDISDSRIKELQHKQYATSDIGSLDTENKDIQNRIDNINFNEGNLEYEKQSLEAIEEKLKAMKQNRGTDSMSQEIRAKNNEIMTLENELEAVAHDITQTHKHSDVHAKISLLSDELKFKEKAKGKLIETHRETFQNFGFETSNLLADYNKNVQDLKSDLDAKEKALQLGEKEVSRLLNSIGYRESSVKKQEATIKDATDAVMKCLEEGDDVDDYVELVSSAEDDYKTALENLKMHTTTLQFNKKALEVAENTHCCYLCSREFESNPGLESFIVELKKKTDDQLDTQLRTQLEEAKNYLQELRSVSADVENIHSAKKQIQEIKEAIEMDSMELEEAKGSAKALEDEVATLKDKVSKLDSLRNTINDIMRLDEDLQTVKKQLDQKQQELSAYGFSSKGLDELQADYAERTENLKKLRKAVSSLQENKESVQRELTMLEGNVKDKRLLISNMERAVIEKENLARSIDQNKKKISDLKKSVAKADSLIAELDKSIAEKQNAFNEAKARDAEEITELRQFNTKISNYFNELAALNKQIAHHEQVDAARLRECESKIGEVKSTISNLEKTMRETSDYVVEEELRLADSANEERNIRANLELRELNVRLEDIQNNIASIDAEKAESERDRYQERSNELHQKYTNLRAELAGKRGEIRQIEDQADQLSKELSTEFKDVEQKYREEWTKLQTRTVVDSDLQTYSKALDNAIMSYHGLKMREINRIIDELWKTTYSGSDVDTIKIKSEKSGTANKSYNYRVVMVKQDAELDMRGRCSAGQKVLAAIIIRLALSECFGTNCGVIALDEPTTNLDSDNIESLAHSLGRIIEMRKSQKNFQLIVITHDEKFLNSMGASKYTDHFFRLRRDEAQNSQIEWVDITRVIE